MLKCFHIRPKNYIKKRIKLFLPLKLQYCKHNNHDSKLHFKLAEELIYDL